MVVIQLIFTKFSMNFSSFDFKIVSLLNVHGSRASKKRLNHAWNGFYFLNLQNEIFSYCAAGGGEPHPDWLESPVPESS